MSKSAQTEIVPETEQETRQDLEWRVAESLGERARVLVHNDDFTPYDYVIMVLQTVFHLPRPEAEHVTYQAHTTGLAHVITLPVEEAKYRVGKAHSMARMAGYPLTFTIEPE